MFTDGFSRNRLRSALSFLVVVCMAWTGLAIASNASTYAATNTNFTVTDGTANHTIVVYDPRLSPSSAKIPVVITTAQNGIPVNWAAQSDAHNFLVVSFYATGAGPSIPTNPTLLANVLTYLKDPAHNYNVDSNRIYIVGHSKTAGFFQKIICDGANASIKNQLAGVGISGNSFRSFDPNDASNQHPTYASGGIRGCPTPAGTSRSAHVADLVGPLPSIIIFGQNEGGLNANVCDPNGELDTSIVSCTNTTAEEMNYWSSEVNGCTNISPALPRNYTWPQNTTSGPALTYNGTGCRARGATRLMVFPGEDHGTPDIDQSTYEWAYLSQFSLNGTGTTTTTTSTTVHPTTTTTSTTVHPTTTTTSTTVHPTTTTTSTTVHPTTTTTSTTVHPTTTTTSTTVHPTTTTTSTTVHPTTTTTSTTVHPTTTTTSTTVHPTTTTTSTTRPTSTTTTTVPATRASVPTPMPIPLSRDLSEYALVASDGGMFCFGGWQSLGSMGSSPLNKPIVGTASTPSGNGYWQVASDGGIFSFGDAQFFGSTGSIKLNQPIVGMSATSTGKGYWLVASDGGIFAYGDAKFFGSTGAIKLNKPIVGMSTTPTGNGYWLVASDGGIFAYGDAQFFGSTGSIKLNQPIVGMSATKSGNGYWMVARDGGIFAYGDAQYFGSTGDSKTAQPIVGMAPTRDGNGYWLAGVSGAIYNFGSAVNSGDVSQVKLNQPIVGIAS